MTEELKLIVHVAHKERWMVGVKNALNFLRSAEPGDNLRVRIIANTDSVTQCIKCDRPLFDRLKQLILDGGEIYLCSNSLRDFEIKESRLPEIFKTVPAAVRAIADWQAQGWLYIRA